MIFLDTHALLFLASDHAQFPKAIWPLLETEELVYSPMARIELDFLFEIKRINGDPRTICEVLSRDFGLRIEQDAWTRAAEIASTLSWTRDPFDRLIVAHALVWGCPLLSRNRTIRQYYHHAFWDELEHR